MVKKRKVKVKKKATGFKNSKSFYLFLFLVFLNIILVLLVLGQSKGFFVPKQPGPIIVDNTIDLDDLSLQQKIAQMTVVLGVKYYSGALKKMQLGGIHLHTLADEQVFRSTITHFQKDMKVPFMVTVDLEGCVNPFAHYRNFTAAKNITTVGQAFEKGKIEGKYLKDLGVTVNFAPVVDLDDQIWNCRSFPGGKENISELANSYILGLQDEGIMGTIKHYPGQTLVIKDPHKYLAAAEITNQDLYPYQKLSERTSTKAVMVSHLITYGKVNSEGKPSVASQKIINHLKKDVGFKGMVISDEINMQGMKKFYPTLDEMYVDVFKAGSDVILNFNTDPNEIHRMIKVIEKAVWKGDIDEDKIDESVRKILRFKGFKVVD
tara:strand:+ start:1648 stop:2778 length:1131 start_codon:yes stop_codon:yes gene_type:complete